ncbi:thioredoxin family protein [Acidobacteriota bacterium]
MKQKTFFTILTDENFKEEVLQSHQPVLVQISAEWSGGCQIMVPILERVVDKFNGQIKFANLNFNGQGNVLREYSIYELPVFLLFDNGCVVDLIVGAVAREILELSINEVLNKNMEV